MSAWTDEEVDKLEQQGGNDVARRTWLKHAPPTGQGGRPQPGSDLNVFKSFVVDVYERRKYFGDDEGAGEKPAPAFASAPVPAAQRVVIQAPAVAAAPASAPLPPVMDLLDFSAPAAETATAPAQNHVFHANFDSFFPVPTTAACTPPPAQPPSAPTSSGFAFLQPPTAVMSDPSKGSFTGIGAATNSVNSFVADFSGLEVSSSPAPAVFTMTCNTATKKPIMGGASANNSCAISNLMMMVSGPTLPMNSNVAGSGGNMMMTNNSVQQQPNNMNPTGGMNPMQQQNLIMMQRQLMIQMNNGSMNPQQQQQMMFMMQQQQQQMMMVNSGSGLSMNQQFNNGMNNNGMQMNYGMQTNNGGMNSMSGSMKNGNHQFPSNWS